VASAASGPADADPLPRPIPAHRLLGSGRRVLIEHEGSLYELRLTRNNKLILTK